MSELEFKLLDHGYLKLIEPWGSDRRIVEAARMSTDKGFLGWGHPGDWECARCGHTLSNELYIDYTYMNDDRYRCCIGRHLVQLPPTVGDEKLLSYLWNNEHKTPFEMAGAIIEVQAPIVVFREWHRHRTQSYNELSARYTQIPNFNYLPSVDRLLVNAHGSNKQANRLDGAPVLTEAAATMWLTQLGDLYNEAQRVYQLGLEIGVPKELARLAVTVARYSRMRASANLRNWLAFITLRSAPGAQQEIRVYSDAMQEVVAHCWPRTYALFKKGTACH